MNIYIVTVEDSLFPSSTPVAWGKMPKMNHHPLSSFPPSCQTGMKYTPNPLTFLKWCHAYTNIHGSCPAEVQPSINFFFWTFPYCNEVMYLRSLHQLPLPCIQRVSSLATCQDLFSSSQLWATNFFLLSDWMIWSTTLKTNQFCFNLLLIVLF